MESAEAFKPAALFYSMRPKAHGLARSRVHAQKS